jgi:large subunit ribosomal protein L9
MATKTTKLLLVQDVDNLGRRGDIVNAKAGYARNFLVPQGFAVVADQRAVRMQVRHQEERAKQAIVDRADAEKVALQITNIELSIDVKVDHEGHMYGSVTVADIITKVQEEKGILLEKKSVLLKHPIKEIGVHEIDLRLKEGVTSKIIVKVNSETAELNV